MKLLSSWLVPCLALATSACGAVYSGPGTAKGSFERTLEISGPVQVEVSTGSGAVNVRAGETEHVKIKAVVVVRDAILDSARSEDILREIEKNPPVRRDGDTIRIGELHDQQTRNRVSISYELTVPVRSRVRSTTGSGEQSVRGVAGAIEVETGSGAIEIAGSRADVRAATGSGSVRLEDARDGRLHLQTGSGSIHAADVKGVLRAKTGSGSIAVEGEPLERWELETGSGSITAKVAASVGFEVDAHTGSGSIKVAQPLAHSSKVSRDALRGRVGAGGALLALSTGSGDIRVE